MQSPRRFPDAHARRFFVVFMALTLAFGFGWALVQHEAMPTHVEAAQNVDWLSPDAASLLGTSGIDVLVPGWVPGPASAVAPEIYAESGTYSLYWYVAADSPTYLQITGTSGAGFPGGSQANLNVELTVNTSVQGYPAIQDPGIPEGGSAPIYDKVMFIANGVLYTVTGNNLDTSAQGIADGLISLQVPSAPATEVPTEVVVVPTDVPVTEPTTDTSTDVGNTTTDPSTTDTTTDSSTTDNTVSTDSTTTTDTTGDTPTDTTTTDATTNSVPSDTATTDTAPAETGSTTSAEATSPAAQPTATTTESSGRVGDGTSGGYSPGVFETGVPSDGTGGPRPPVVGGDGTGGLYDAGNP